MLVEASMMRNLRFVFIRGINKLYLFTAMALLVGCIPSVTPIPDPQNSSTLLPGRMPTSPTGSYTVTPQASISNDSSIATATPVATPIADKFLDGVRVTFIFNAGFLITAGDRRIMVDVIYDGYPGGMLKPVLDALPPFDDVNLILATHEHVDHFSPALVRQYLLANPNTFFASTPSAVEQLLALGEDLKERTISIDVKEGESKQFEVDGMIVEAVYLSHGVDDLLNLGFIITVGGVTIFHTGDVDFESIAVSDLLSYQLPERQIDLAFVPSYSFTDPSYHIYLLEGIHARHLIPMHFYGTLSLPMGFETVFPNHSILGNSYESWVLP